MWTSGGEVNPSLRGAYANLTREPTQGSASNLGFAPRKFTINIFKCEKSPKLHPDGA